MKTISEIIEKKEIWFTSDECYCSDTNKFLGYMSFFSTQKPGLLLGEPTKNNDFKIVLFDNEKNAIEASKEYYNKHKI